MTESYGFTPKDVVYVPPGAKPLHNCGEFLDVPDRPALGTVAECPKCHKTWVYRMSIEVFGSHAGQVDWYAEKRREKRRRERQQRRESGAL